MPKKSLDETMDETVGESEKTPSYEDRLKNVNVIANPLAGKKLTRKLLKLIKKACTDKNNFYVGLKIVQLKLKKNEKGLVIFAGDVLPLDTMTHLPALCEDHQVSYIYVPSQADIGRAMGVGRNVIMVMIKPGSAYSQYFEECLEAVKEVPVPF